MNPNNYASLEASKRLVEAGIVLETDVWWAVGHQSKTFQLLTKNDAQQWIKDREGDIYPAPSMAEVWRELPLGTRAYRGEVFTEAYLKTYKHDVIISENPADALIDLLIWVKKEADDGRNNR